jgi:pimeloyl-ACP methyl ester carboxylesterase
MAPERPFLIQTRHARLAAVWHQAPGRRLVILCHGFTGDKSAFGRLLVQAAQVLAKAGFNALRFDFMGSGDSSGAFSDMSPNTQVRDALDVLAWARRRGYRQVALLGHSFGASTAIAAAYQAKPRPAALVTWCSIPSLKNWKTIHPYPPPQRGNPLIPGKAFYTDRPKVDTPEAWVNLDIPRFQIQGDHDNPGFLEEFSAYCPKNDPLVRHLVLPGADHLFTEWSIRRRVIAESVRWLKRHLD